jgi:hypothetical protein
MSILLQDLGISGLHNISVCFRVLEGTISRFFRLHLQSLAPINPYWARVVVMVRSPCGNP